MTGGWETGGGGAALAMFSTALRESSTAWRSEPSTLAGGCAGPDSISASSSATLMEGALSDLRSPQPRVRPTSPPAATTSSRPASRPPSGQRLLAKQPGSLIKHP
jgi:hypothetical protein